MQLEQLRTRLDYQTFLLAGFALIASALLGVGDLATRDVIELRRAEDLKASLAQVVPASLYDNDLLQDVILVDSKDDGIGADQTQVYIARKEGKVAAVSFKLVAPDGYSGAIYLIMGVDREGGILGVRVISHTETPGLGDKIEAAKSAWVQSFNGRSLKNLTPGQWAVKKDGGVFDQFSGATITPRSVVKAVYRGLGFFQNHRAELIGAAD